MRNRVAHSAALLLLIALILLCMLMLRNNVYQRNEVMNKQLSSIVEMTGMALTGASDEVREEALVKVKDVDTISAGYYNSDREAVWVSDDSMQKYLPKVVADQDIEVGKVANGYFMDNNDERNVFATYRFEDDSYLVVIAQAWTMTTLLTGKFGAFFIFGLAGLSLLIIILVWSSYQKNSRMLESVMRTLEKFSEGDFDARIPLLKGSDPVLKDYNDIIERIDSRIFKQRNRNQVMATVLNQMQNGIIAVDQNLNILLVTPIAKRLLGINGRTEGVHINDASSDVKLEEVLTEAMNQCGVYTNEVAARTSVGRGHRPLRLYVSAMRENGVVVGALALVEDITELRRLEEVRTDFAANVSHELKTPITSIRGFVETLEAGAINNPETAKKFLRIIGMEVERLTRLINDILSISKLESGNVEVATERIRIDREAYDVCDMLSIQAAEKNITLNYPDTSKPIYIMGNKDRVEQLLINLIENGMKYNNPGGSVTVQVFERGNDVNISIADTGIGIKEENLPRLFERFYRVDKGRSRQMGGTGLGLSIVKHIVKSMHGEIEVCSRYGEGTEFLIILPKVLSDDPEKDTIFDEN